MASCTVLNIPVPSAATVIWDGSVDGRVVGWVAGSANANAQIIAVRPRDNGLNKYVTSIVRPLKEYIVHFE
jgi:hypothetical protein